MLKKNDNIKSIIENYGCNAEGVCKANGQIVFVPYTIQNEKIEATIILDKKNFLIGKATKIVTPSENRIDAPCPYFSKCGGCQLQHIKYGEGLKIKTKILQDTITNIAKQNFVVSPCRPSENQYQYRNKMALPINPKTRKVGMFRLSSHSIVDIDNCWLAKPNLNKLINVFNNYLQISQTTIYDEIKKTGVLKTLVAREINGKLLVTVVVNADDLSDKQLLIDLLKNNFAEVGLSLNINKQNNNVILTEKFKHIFGLKEIVVKENGITYSINNQSFLQINDEIKSEIYAEVFKQVENGFVINAYSGAGLLSAMLCTHASQVVGIEIIDAATVLANKLKEQNNIQNLHNLTADCTTELPKIINKLSTVEKENLSVVLDPPRKGCSVEVLNAIINAAPKNIIYISCNPSTLARDLKVVMDSGIYEINSIQGYDMFPQTKHIETLCILTKK